MRCRSISVSAILVAGGPLLAAQVQESEQLLAGDGGASDRFGFSTAISGDSLLVGATEHDGGGSLTGAVYLFEREPTGWSEAAELVPSGPGVGTWFGNAVAIDGDTAVVGARSDSVGGTEKGSAYVFEDSPSGWIQTSLLTSADAAHDDYFGDALAIRGDRILVGAWGDEGASGSVYAFERTGSTWLEVDKLRASDAADDDLFGRSVAMVDDLALIGAMGNDDAGQFSGSAYLFERQAGGWVEIAKWVAADASMLASFGSSVALTPQAAFVGAIGDGQGAFHAGAAYVFERPGSEWVQVQKLVPCGLVMNDRFGSAVAAEGDRVVIGAPQEEFLGNAPGAAHVFRRGDSNWQWVADLTPSSGEPMDQFGQSIALEGDTVIVGAPADDDAGDLSGSAFVFDLSADYATLYCACGSGSPCGNTYADGGCANSAGMGARLVVSGSASVAADDLRLTVVDMPPNKFGIIYKGSSQLAVPFGDGLRCVGNVGGRYPVRQANSCGTLVEGPGVVGISLLIHPPAFQIQPGSTWNFQGWYRDPMGSCGAGFNLTNGAEIVFVP